MPEGPGSIPSTKPRWCYKIQRSVATAPALQYHSASQPLCLSACWLLRPRYAPRPLALLEPPDPQSTTADNPGPVPSSPVSKQLQTDCALLCNCVCFPGFSFGLARRIARETVQGLRCVVLLFAVPARTFQRNKKGTKPHQFRSSSAHSTFFL